MLKTKNNGGLLPDRYHGNVALQVTSVDQSITPETWTTSIATLMRPLGNRSNPAVVKVVPKLMPKQPTRDILYPPLVPIAWRKSNAVLFGKVVKAAIGDTYSKTIRASIVWLASKEQNFNVPNYNHYGVQTDINWGNGLKRYIDGSFNSKEGTAGQGVGAGQGNMRLFASFRTEEDGIKWVASRLKAKGWDNTSSDPNSPNFITRKHLGSWLFGSFGEAAQKVWNRNTAAMKESNSKKFKRYLAAQ